MLLLYLFQDTLISLLLIKSDLHPKCLLHCRLQTFPSLQVLRGSFTFNEEKHRRPHFHRSYSSHRQSMSRK